MLFLLNLSSCVVKGSMDGLIQQDLEGMTMPELHRVYVAVDQMDKFLVKP